MSETAQAPAPAAPPASPDVPQAPPGFFARAEHAAGHAIEQMLPGHGDSAPAGVTGEPQQAVQTSALHAHAAQVLDLVRAILELEADHYGQAGLDGLAVKALRVAGSVAAIAGLAG